jgi:ADP-ribose pyrophosphatase YjhB (NUDIX family)
MWIDDYSDDQVTLNAYYVCAPAGGLEAATDSDEVSEARWFAPHELPSEDEMSFPTHQPRVIEAWLATRGEPAQRLVDRPA